MAVSYYVVAEFKMHAGCWGAEARDEVEERSLPVSPYSMLAVIGLNLEAIRLGECVMVERTDEMIRMEI